MPAHRLSISLLALFAFLSVGAGNAQAQMSRVSVTIISVNNKACVDQFVFCGKADMMVRVGFRQPDGTMTFCPDTTPIVNVDNIGPLPPCTGIAIEPPFDVVISLFDVDEGNVPAKPGTSIIIQSQFQLSNDPNAPNDAVIPWFRLGAGTIAITGPQANLSFTITITPVAPTFQGPLTASVGSFDPQLGEHVFVSDHLLMSDDRSPYAATTHVLISVRPAAGGASTQIADATIHGFFNLDWDGKLNGQPVPSGNFIIDAKLATGGATESVPVAVASVPKVFEISNPVSTGAWNPRAGALSFPFRLNPGAVVTTRVDGPAIAGGACQAGTALPVAAPSVSALLGAGVGVLPVQMKNATGVFLPTGNYCVHFDATTNTGLALGGVTKEINLNNAPPLRLVVSLHPSVPALLPAVPLTPGSTRFVPSVPVFVEARALDDQRADRPTGTITVRAIPSLGIAIAPSAISTATCSGTSVCRVVVSASTLALAAGGTDFAGALAFDAMASDLPNPSGMDSPASVTLATREAFLTAPSPNMVVEASVPVTGNTASGFALAPRNSTIDVAFHAGTGLDLSVSAQANTFLDIIGQSLNLFLGGNASVGDTSTMPGLGSQNIAFWVSQKPATVVVQPNSNPPNLCDRTHVDSVPFAEVQAVIHTVNCRDNADWNGATFSAEFGAGPVENIAWHEFHHAAYDLADEYPPDGGYFETSDFPNVMSNANECTLKGAFPAQCAQIGTTGWWRAAPMPDVMIDNTKENLDETRRATLIFNRCKGGQC